MNLAPKELYFRGFVRAKSLLYPMDRPLDPDVCSVHRTLRLNLTIGVVHSA
jgi:hypothetical protein